MPSKWDKYRGKLDKFQLEPTYQEKVEEIKSQIYCASCRIYEDILFADGFCTRCGAKVEDYKGLTAPELAREYKREDDIKDRFEFAVKAQNLRLEALSQLIVEELEGQKVQTIELSSGMKVGLKTEPYVTVLPTEEAASGYVKWVHSDEIKNLLTLNAQTRNSLIKGMLEDGNGSKVPAWCKVFLKTSAKLTGKKKEREGDGDRED